MVVQVAAPLAPVDHELGELLAVLLLAGPLTLAGTLGGGYLLARTARRRSTGWPRRPTRSPQRGWTGGWRPLTPTMSWGGWPGRSTE